MEETGGRGGGREMEPVGEDVRAEESMGKGCADGMRTGKGRPREAEEDEGG